MPSRRNLCETVIKCHADDFEEMFDSFAKENWREFQGCGIMQETEHKLEFMDMFQEFSSMIENKIEGILKDHNATMKDLIDECKYELQQDGENKWIVEFLLASTEYSRFFMLMSNEAKAQELESK